VQKHVPKKDDWTNEEVLMYTDLKDRERDGLSNIVLEIIRRKPIVHKHFAAYMRDAQKQVKKDIQKEGGIYQTRIINTVSLFIAISKIWEDFVKDLPLPFTFADFYEDAKRQITRQSEELSTSNRLSIFFNFIGMEHAQGRIMSGREFDIAIVSSVTIQINRTETEEICWDGESKKVLYMIITDIIMSYQKMHNSESLKLTTLRMYLRDHPAYIGQVKSHKFIYQVESWKNDPATGRNERIIEKVERNTSCIALDYKVIYAMGIDLERSKMTDQTSLDINSPDNLPQPQNDKNDLPF
jgi:hypothetical protein